MLPTPRKATLRARVPKAPLARHLLQSCHRAAAECAPALLDQKTAVEMRAEHSGTSTKTTDLRVHDISGSSCVSFELQSSTSELRNFDADCLFLDAAARGKRPNFEADICVGPLASSAKVNGPSVVLVFHKQQDRAIVRTVKLRQRTELPLQQRRPAFVMA